MGLFDTEEGVLEYERIAEGYDGRELVARLRTHLAEGSTVLEIGMGPGKDLDMLLEAYDATGSDMSAVFLERYRSRRGAKDPQLLQLDAVTLDTDQTFDALYSNKVLHHLHREELKRSFTRQAELLRPGGIALHSFWYGDKEEEHSGLRFVYYNEETISRMWSSSFKLIECARYAEMEDRDSMVVVLGRLDQNRLGLVPSDG